jgi:predicted ArsR family transcriptional regulator
MATRQEDTTFRVMRLLQANPDLTQRELAEQLGVSVSGLNYCLKALMQKGWVKMKNFAHTACPPSKKSPVAARPTWPKWWINSTKRSSPPVLTRPAPFG